VDVGSWFNRTNPKFARDDYAEECIPTLAHVFELCRQNTATIYVEMKSEKRDVATELAQTVARLVKDFKFQNRVVVVSFNLGAITILKTRDASIRTGALFGTTGMTSRNWQENILAATAECAAEELLLHRLLARRSFVEKAHDLLRVSVWTVDDAKWVERARLLKLHALFTNHPAKLLAAK
jgi:glycerophosphoryl diester phosphodiesterase family protein